MRKRYASPASPTATVHSGTMAPTTANTTPRITPTSADTPRSFSVLCILLIQKNSKKMKSVTRLLCKATESGFSEMKNGILARAKAELMIRTLSGTTSYNKERTAFQKAFEGHRSSIIEDEIKTDKILKDILKQVEAYRTKFNDILPLKERMALNSFVKILKKPAEEVDFNSVCNYLATLSGRLSKKEDKKNG